MKSSLIVGQLQLSQYQKNWKWFLFWGLALVLLGSMAIATATFTTYLSVIFIGVLIFLSGLVITIDSFSFWWGKWSGFFLHVVMGILYITAGYVLIDAPLLGSIPLTLFLGIFYGVIGLSRLAFSVWLRTPKWGWSFLNGLLSLLLGILIIAELPSSALFIIGLFVGIDLLFSGFAYLMLAIAARSA